MMRTVKINRRAIKKAKRRTTDVRWRFSTGTDGKAMHGSWEIHALENITFGYDGRSQLLPS